MTSFTLPVYGLGIGVDAVSSATVLGGLEATPLQMFLGLIPGTRVTCQGRSPAGDPAAYLVRGTVVALRARDAAAVGLASGPVTV